MAFPIILTALAAVASAIWGGVKYVSEKALTIAIAVLDFGKTAFSWVISVAKANKVTGILVSFLFVFFIIFMIDGISTFVISFSFVCDENNDLHRTQSIFGGFQAVFYAAVEDVENSSTSFDKFLANSTHRYVDPDSDTDMRNVVKVQCLSNKPRLTFFGIDVFDYRIWIMLMFIGAMFAVGAYVRK